MENVILVTFVMIHRNLVPEIDDLNRIYFISINVFETFSSSSNQCQNRSRTEMGRSVWVIMRFSNWEHPKNCPIPCPTSFDVLMAQL